VRIFVSDRQFARAAGEAQRLVDQIGGELSVACGDGNRQTIAGFVAETDGAGAGLVGLGWLGHDWGNERADQGFLRFVATR
jgi:hypothetical protein